MLENRSPVNGPLEFWNCQPHKPKSALKLAFRNTSGNHILLIIQWEPSPNQYWNYPIKDSANFHLNLALDPHSSLNECVSGRRMKAWAEHLYLELPSHSLPVPAFVYLWSIFLFVSEGSIGLLFMYWNKKIWWELTVSPRGNCLSPWFTSLVFLLTNCQASENWSQPKSGPWQLVWKVRQETSVSQLLEWGEWGGWVGRRE